MSDELEITGLTETCEFLLALPDELSRDGIEQALIAGSVPIQKQLRSRLPHRDRSGNVSGQEFEPLENSLVTDIHVDRSAKIGVASTGFGKSGPVALWQEYGHRIVTHEKLDTGKLSVANPFMRLSVSAAADDAVDAFAESIIGTIERKANV